MIRTDLADEACKNFKNDEGIFIEESEQKGIKIFYADIKSQAAAKRAGRQVGKYYTFSVGDLFKSGETREGAALLSKHIRMLLGGAENVLVIGLGNTDITPDALGPKTAERVLATRHLKREFLKSAGLETLLPVSVIAPGVLGQTGIESAEILRALCDKIAPDAVIAIDALCAAEPVRLCSTVQLSNAGISPGSGVGNRRLEISKATLSIPVIAIGVPTVTDSSAFGGQGGFIVTPREIDTLIIKASELLSTAINLALQPGTDEETVLALV